MRIAFVVSDMSFPVREGLHALPARVIASLTAAGHDVRVSGFVRDRSAVDVRRMQTSLGLAHEPTFEHYSGLMLLRAAREQRLPSPAARRVADQVRRLHPDVLHLDGRLACTLRDLLPGYPAVSSLVDPPSIREVRLLERSSGTLQRLKARLRLRLALDFEERLRDPRTLWHVVSEVDAAYVRDVHPGQPIAAVPQPPEEMTSQTLHVPDVRAVGLIADMRQDYLARDVVDAVRSLDRSLAHDVPVLVLGRAPQRELMWPDMPPRVQYLDWVDDLGSFLSRVSVVVLPDSYGSGIKTRALDLMATGVPLVATSVACEGIPARDGEHVLLADGPDQIASHVAVLLDHDALAADLAARARELSRSMSASSTGSWAEVYRAAAVVHAAS